MFEILSFAAVTEPRFEVLEFECFERVSIEKNISRK